MLFKLVGYVILIAVIGGFVWLYPKYDFVKKNPGFCTQLVDHIYYCGNASDIQSFLKK